MVAVCEFIVTGKPQTQVRTRSTSNGRHYNTEAVTRSRAVIAAAAREAMNGADPFAVPVSVELHIVMRAPNGNPRRHGAWADRAPDSSNILKNFEDAIEGVVYDNDARIVDHKITRTYARDAEGVHVIVRPAEAPPEMCGAILSAMTTKPNKKAKIK